MRASASPPAHHFWILFVGWQLTFLAAVFLEANYYRAGGHLGWTAPLTAEYIFSGIAAISGTDFLIHLKNSENLVHVGVHLFVTILSIFCFFRSIGQRSTAISFLGISMLVLLLGGWLGAASMLFSLIGSERPDGEWLGEDFPYPFPPPHGIGLPRYMPFPRQLAKFSSGEIATKGQ